MDQLQNKVREADATAQKLAAALERCQQLEERTKRLERELLDARKFHTPVSCFMQSLQIHVRRVRDAGYRSLYHWHNFSTAGDAPLHGTATECRGARGSARAARSRHEATGRRPPRQRVPPQRARRR